MRSLGERSDRDLIFRQALLNSKPVAGQDSLFASAVIDRKKKEITIKIVNSLLWRKQLRFTVIKLAM